MSSETKKELFRAHDSLGDKINSLRAELNKAHDERESSFAKKSEISNNIKDLIREIKDKKALRDSLTRTVKELKEKRDSMSKDIKQRISQIRNLTKEKNLLISKSKIKNPNRLRGDIAKTETKLETEAMSFEKEKEISKKLRTLKKNFNEAREIIEIAQNIRALDSAIKSKTGERDELHESIQKTAKQSQDLHEKILAISKKIDSLKPSEKEALKKSAEMKRKFNTLNKELKQKLLESSELSKKINNFKLEESERKRLRERNIIKKKELEIEEKIKKKQKLTNEDFIPYQE